MDNKDGYQFEEYIGFSEIQTLSFMLKAYIWGEHINRKPLTKKM